MHALRSRIAALKFFLLGLVWRIKYSLVPERMPRNKDGKVYLNLGCGEYTDVEFINMDAVPFRKTHIVGDIQNLGMFPTGSVDMMYASHVIEHVPRGNLTKTLREWHRVLKPGGVLRFGVPDFDALIQMYQRSGNDVESIVNQLLGQDGEYDDHHTIWNRAYAEKILREAGFREVREWEPGEAEHHNFTDKTNRAFKIEGERIPISLNLEAIKGVV